MLLHDLEEKKLIFPQEFLADGTQYLTVMGSNAYGVSTDESDYDVYGFTIPPKEMVFPQHVGVVRGFGHQGDNFEVWSQHQIMHNGREYDFSVYSIIRYFHLCMENNPNMLDSLFTPDRCVIHSTPISKHMRANRKMFLHTGSFPKFKGYAYSQLKKLKTKQKVGNEEKQLLIDAHGYDTKAGCHVVRLALECQQILQEGDLDMERNKDQLRAVRAGEWSLERLEQFFAEKELQLEQMAADSKLPAGPDERKIKELLLNCLEQFYGSLDATIASNADIAHLLADMTAVMNKYR